MKNHQRIQQRPFPLALIILLLMQSVLHAQTDTSYSFIVAGHAYGAHSGTNIGLHPPFLDCLSTGVNPETAFIVLTGDIVNESTTASWTQVEEELDALNLPYYYVMGNHDNNSIGYDVFEEKYGSSYYSFTSQSELFIVLNSTEDERSVSSTQLTFLEQALNQADEQIKNIFIFFHEVLWNSHQKYKDVRSNSRSRYGNMVNYSNYWEEVHPLLTAMPDKEFFMISGDVGGNDDAIAAFYDQWDHVTLLSSGMGEVVDENYLLVRIINKDSINLELLPLDSETELPAIEYYSVPPAPGIIEGPEIIEENDANFLVREVFNAESYQWELPEGASGISTSNSIEVNFDTEFSEGSISVKAERDGFGLGPASSLFVRMESMDTESAETDGDIRVEAIQSNNNISFRIYNISDDEIYCYICDISGRTIKSFRLKTRDKRAEIQISRSELPMGIVVLHLSSKTQSIAKKFLIK